MNTRKCTNCKQTKPWYSSLLAFRKTYHFCSKTCEEIFKNQNFEKEKKRDLE